MIFQLFTGELHLVEVSRLGTGSSSAQGTEIADLANAILKNYISSFISIHDRN